MSPIHNLDKGKERIPYGRDDIRRSFGSETTRNIWSFDAPRIEANNKAMTEQSVIRREQLASTQSEMALQQQVIECKAEENKRLKKDLDMIRVEAYEARVEAYEAKQLLHATEGNFCDLLQETEELRLKNEQLRDQNEQLLAHLQGWMKMANAYLRPSKLVDQAKTV